MKFSKSLLIIIVQIITSSAGAAPFVYIVTQSAVQVVDTSTNTIVDTITGLVIGDSIVITPDNKFAYATDEGNSHSVFVIDLITNTIVVTITSPQINVNGTGAITVTPNGDTVYVANDQINTVTMIDVATNTVIGSIVVGSGPSCIVITSDGTTAYVTNLNDNTISVIDIATSTVTDTISSAQFNGIADIAITPDGKTAYASNLNTGDISIIDIATNTVSGSPIATIPTSSGLAITPDGKTLYVTILFGVIIIIDIATNTVIGSIAVGLTPEFMIILPDGLTGYLTNLGSGTVSVINIATNEVVDMITTDPEPFGIATTHLMKTVIGRVEYDIFLNTREPVFVARWEPFFDNTVSYRIFNRNGCLIGIVSAQRPLQFFLCFCSPVELQGLSVVAVSPTGTESVHVPVTII